MKHFKDKLSNILELPLDLNCAAINQYFWNIFFVNNPVVLSLSHKIVQYFELCCGVSGETEKGRVAGGERVPCVSHAGSLEI